MASAPLIFHIPHASIAIPPEARQGRVVTDAELAIELLHMTDRYTDEIFKRAVRQGDAVVEFPVSRLVVDPERFVDDDKEAMAARGMGVVYLRRHDGSALRADLTQKTALVRDYYEPHHRRLEECVFQHLRGFGRATIIDCHSFPSVPLPYELVQDQHRPEICIGAAPVHTPEWLFAALVSAFERQRYSVSVDTPFAGTIVPARFFRRSERVLSAMNEIRRDLYMDENTGEHRATLPDVAADMAMAMAMAAVREAWGKGEASLSSP